VRDISFAEMDGGDVVGVYFPRAVHMIEQFDRRALCVGIKVASHL
jgi:hypothetical protein